jgi:hypothetical protein
MERYEHKQVAYWMYWFAIAMLMFFMLISSAFGSGFVPAGISLLVAVIIFVFSRLETRVDEQAISWSFGWGWPGANLALADVASIEITRTSLVEGFGIHWTIWHGWLWNVGGFQAVELHTRSGGRVTLGTDDPEGLYDAILAHRRELG